MEPIELSTDGLLLRAWQESDAADVFRAAQDPLIQRWTLIPVPYLRDHADWFVGQYTRSAWMTESAAPLGVFDARSGELLGASGLTELDRGAGTASLGTWVAPWARGRAVAERSGRAVAHWCFEVLKLRRLSWIVEVGNHASRLIAERIGFSFDGVVRASQRDRHNNLNNVWHGTALPGEIRDTPPAWVAPGAPGAIRAATFGRPPERVNGDRRNPISLRLPAERDIDDVVAACADPESARWTTVPIPYERANAAAFVCEYVPEQWRRGTTATFVVADPADRYAGTFDLRINPTDPAAAELGFMVAPWSRGKGYATAATRLICTWGFAALGLRRILWRAHVGNEASRRVAEKAGFTFEGVQRAGVDQRGVRKDAWVAALLAEDQ
jgi:RimJ/RimL family protein N-acetyltransferase